MPVRLVATDLDGTLLRSDGTVSDRTRAALRAAVDAGLVVVFVTGRPPRWLDAIVDETGHLGTAVGANGAVIYDMADERMLKTHPLQPDVMREIAADLRAKFPAVHFAAEYGNLFAAEPGYVHDWAINPRSDRNGRPIPPPIVADLEIITEDAALKMLAKDRGAEPDEFLFAATTLIGERATVTHSSSYGLLEISAAGVTKATGLAEVATTHGLDHTDVLAIGDMPNDVPMLEWAGRSLAVGNAHPSAIEVADDVIGTNDEDAVARVIEALL
jgi:Cof subfamily protein (haloacid dehalogenase superfamily)